VIFPFWRSISELQILVSTGGDSDHGENDSMDFNDAV